MQDTLTVKSVTKVIGLECVDSTQNLAKELALAGEPEGTMVLACCQTAGRGRYERSFDSGEGGVYFTLILRPQKPAACNASLSVRVGEAVAKTLTEMFGFKTKIKHPNDVLVWEAQSKKWKKICGILIESSTEANHTQWLLVGVGINVNNRLSASLQDGATSVKKVLGREIDPEWILQEVLESFFAQYAQWQLSSQI